MGKSNVNNWSKYSKYYDGLRVSQFKELDSLVGGNRLNPVYQVIVYGMNLSEGLIKSYPVKVVKNYMDDLFGFDPDKVIKIAKGADGSDVVTVVVPDPDKFPEDKGLVRYIGEIERVMSGLCGYYHTQDLPYSADNRYNRMQFEPKFKEDRVDIREFAVDGHIFHLTPYTKVDKILKNGLVPRCDNLNFKYPGRIYFCGRELYDGYYRNLANMLRMAAESVCDTYALLAIDVNKVGDAEFYSDTDMKPGLSIYTSDNIPPSAIRVFRYIYLG